MNTTPLVVCLDRQTLPQPLPAPRPAHRWQDYDVTAADQVVERLREATVAVTNKVPLQRAQLERLANLKLIAVSATGYNIIDLEACRELGITVCNVPSYSTDGVAEHTLMLMLALRHRLNEYQQASASWAASSLFCVFRSAVSELKNARVCIVGGGHIGRRVAELAQAFGAEITFAEHKTAAEVRPGYVAFDEALARADIVSLHCPLSAATRGVIGMREIGLMRKEAVVINTARGGLIDESALAFALESGRLAGAALDVLEQEPPPADNPLLRLTHPNLIVTPHIAWASAPSLERMARILVANIEGFLTGRPQNQVV